MASYHDAIKHAAAFLSAAITSTLRQLLETKHLYQSLRIEFDSNTLKGALQKVGRLQTPLAEAEISRLRGGLWHPWQLATEWKGPLYSQVQAGAAMLAFATPHLKLFCRVCDRVEAFNFVSVEDLLGLSISNDSSLSHKTTTQVFAFSFLCQSCKGVPEVLLVRREGEKLVLSGRSPMEYVQVPKAIPKKIERFYSGAVVANQSGQTLAGVFLLRVLIEQWAQDQAQTKELRADEALDEYMKALPADFKARFPSLPSLYEEFSLAIHTAEASTDLFEEGRQQIVEHFEARRLFKL